MFGRSTAAAPDPAMNSPAISAVKNLVTCMLGSSEASGRGACESCGLSSIAAPAHSPYLLRSRWTQALLGDRKSGSKGLSDSSCEVRRKMMRRFVTPAAWIVVALWTAGTAQAQGKAPANALAITPQNAKIAWVGTKPAGKHDGGFNKFSGHIEKGPAGL